MAAYSSNNSYTFYMAIKNSKVFLSPRRTLSLLLCVLFQYFKDFLKTYTTV